MPLIVQINVQDAVLYLRHDPVPVLQVAGTDRYRFLATLAEIKIDAAANPDRMKIAYRTLLRIGIIDNFWILSKRQHPGQHRYS